MELPKQTGKVNFNGWVDEELGKRKVAMGIKWAGLVKLGIESQEFLFEKETLMQRLREANEQIEKLGLAMLALNKVILEKNEKLLMYEMAGDKK